MKLKNLLLLVFIFFTAIPLLLIAVVTMNFYNSKMEKILENDLSVASLTQVAAIENFMHERSIELSVIASYDSVQHLLTPTSTNMDEAFRHKKYIGNILETIASKNEYVKSITILDNSMQIVACSETVHSDAATSLKKIAPSYLDGRLHFSPVLETTIDGKQQKLLAAIQGIYIDDELIGYMIEEVGLEFFEKVRATVSLFNNGTIYLVDGKKQLITAGSTNESRTEFLLSPAERQGYFNAWNARDQSVQHGLLKYQARGEHYLSYYSKLNNSEWILMSTVNTDEILQTTPTFAKFLTALILMLLILYIATTILITSKIIKPLDKIIEKFDLIEATQDYTIRMENSKSRELHYIVSEINSLLANVEGNLKTEKQKQKKLKERASKDPLTGIYNKKAIEEIISSNLEAANSKHRKIGLIYIDIDDFKTFNTNYGHQGGDKVICFVASTIKSLCPLSGRMGGDEFAICVSNIASEDEMKTLIAQLIKGLSQSISLDENLPPITISCSIGAVISGKRRRSSAELLRLADKAMYHVKNRTKNSYYLWPTEK